MIALKYPSVSVKVKMSGRSLPSYRLAISVFVPHSSVFVGTCKSRVILTSEPNLTEVSRVSVKLRYMRQS